MPNVMFSVPNQVVVRMKSAIPAGERSKILVKLLLKEIEKRETNLYNLAAQLETNKDHQQEMLEWEKEFSNDGLDNV